MSVIERVIDRCNYLRKTGIIVIDYNSYALSKQINHRTTILKKKSASTQPKGKRLHTKGRGIDGFILKSGIGVVQARWAEWPPPAHNFLVILVIN